MRDLRRTIFNYSGIRNFCLITMFATVIPEISFGQALVVDTSNIPLLDAKVSEIQIGIRYDLNSNHHKKLSA